MIFEAGTPGGKLFDVALLVSIALSVAVVVLESVEPIRRQFGAALLAAEWLFTVLFTLEYVLRLLSVRRPLSYATSFFGVVDLLAVVPTYLSLFVTGTHSLVVVRALRLMRVFRIFKVTQYVTEINSLVRAVRRTRAKITVFLLTVLTLVLILGAAMYVIEAGSDSGFTSIPRGIYWAIVTMTTVGYGDIAPQTPLGQAMAAFAMVLGYSLIIIPTAIFSTELVAASREETTLACPSCSREGHESDAAHCKFCGAALRTAGSVDG